MKRAIITGGARGIGRAIVELLWERGSDIALLDLDWEGDLRPAGGRDDQRFFATRVDVSSFAGVEAAVSEAIAALDGVDTLVNCAGINRDRVVWKMTEDEWDQVIAVDLKGCFNTIRAVAPHFKAQRGGSIVNISSINGLRGKFGQTNYAAAKAGVIGLTKAVAKELGGFEVTANVVCPGLVLTDMVRAAPPEIVDAAKAEMAIKVLPEPRDVAEAVAFLASNAARRITGEVIRVDSGQYI